MTPPPASELDPMLVVAIENNVLLKQVLKDLGAVKQKQDENHVITLALREHKTIDRVDTLWETMKEIETSLSLIGRLLRGLMLLLPIVIAAAVASHVIFGWP